MALSKAHIKKPKHQKRIVKRTNNQYGKKPIDLIKQNISKDKAGNKTAEDREFNDELPGGGEFYCTECDRHFIDLKVLDGHKKTKVHKKRVKELKEVPYSVQESERCAGLF